MRFVCPELDARSDAWQDLFAVSGTKSAAMAMDGLSLPRVLTLAKMENGLRRAGYYYGATAMLSALYASRSYDATARTIAEFASLCDLSIDTNFSDAAYYAFWIRNLFEARTNLWYIVFTDEGALFCVPKRGENQLTSFSVAGEQHRESICAELVVEGESGGSYPVAPDGRNIVPVTVDDAQKNRIRNKLLSKNHRLTIDSVKDVPVLTWIVYDGEVYVIMSRRVMNSGGGTYYRYEAVLEVNESIDFTAPPVENVTDARLAADAQTLEGKASTFWTNKGFGETIYNISGEDSHSLSSGNFAGNGIISAPDSNYWYVISNKYDSGAAMNIYVPVSFTAKRIYLERKSSSTWGGLVDIWTSQSLPDNSSDSWVTISSEFGSGWGPVSGSTAYYRKDKLGKLIFSAYVTRSSGTGTLIMTLPSGYRPLTQAMQLTVPIYSSSWGYTTIKIDTNGQVTVIGTYTTGYNISIFLTIDLK